MSRVWVMFLCVTVGVFIGHPLWGMTAGIVLGAIVWWLKHDDPYPWQQPRYAPTHPEPRARTPQEVLAKTEVVDEAAVQALQALGANRKAALAALVSIGWAGNTTEERVINALRANPPN